VSNITLDLRKLCILKKKIVLKDVNIYILIKKRLCQVVNYRLILQKRKTRQFEQKMFSSLRNVMTHTVDWTDQITESFVYRWLHAYATLDITLFPSFVGASGVIAIGLSIRLCSDNIILSRKLNWTECVDIRFTITCLIDDLTARLSDHLKWRWIQQTAGNYETSQRTVSLGRLKD